MSVYTPRRAARVLLVDVAGRVLMFEGFDPARPGHRYWFTPGGGLDPDESPAVGAARELAEETGLRLDPAELGDPVWADATEFPFDGVWYRQTQDFFLLRVESWDVDTTGFNDVEQRSIAGHRWWLPDELVASGDLFYPPELPTLLSRLGQSTATDRDETPC
ncbi:NUDIX domain-containing protein [Micromonospora sp. WMMD1120]|uniref:NUDIX hydrolase n=1 Tax=Micromonospora sp. WMMD1120 TaxID=3016106 RepID=UPI002416F080|nr:NUDIX domain-containing protein [Micromonospora sp. WMMD1120]MDG4808350.1 NUDIX domain-containing protein [Micromonospora sp. WMMD1120]